ncbi:MAG: cyclic nucleotide-binding domain-containing protein [Eggerthellaceae bacterium]|nr:cyclic nucleotide-binding domain-containing protein [Eggerthellaceae bacterium]
MRDGELLAATPLFQGSTVEEIGGMLGCLGMRERAYSTGERIHRMGDRIREVGLVLEGSVRIESVDVWGNVSVMGMRGSGQIFGEAYAAIPDCSTSEPSGRVPLGNYGEELAPPGRQRIAQKGDTPLGYS